MTKNLLKCQQFVVILFRSCHLRDLTLHNLIDANTLVARQWMDGNEQQVISLIVLI